MADDELRSDARANRDRIVEIARDAFAADPDVSMNAIAKAAGVGAGTLYRHFACREALLIAVYRKEIQALVDLAPVLLARHTPLVAFRHWCDRLAHFGRMKQGLAAVLHAAMSDRDFQETYWPMVEAIAQFLRAGEASGELRSGVEAEDVLLLLGALWRIDPKKGGKAQAERLIGLVLSGLGAR